MHWGRILVYLKAKPYALPFGETIGALSQGKADSLNLLSFVEADEPPCPIWDNFNACGKHCVGVRPRVDTVQKQLRQRGEIGAGTRTMRLFVRDVESRGKLVRGVRAIAIWV